MRARSVAMSGSEVPVVYPRELRPKEQDALESVLPVDRPAYREYRQFISRMVVIGEGRRGTGNLVLGFKDDTPDNISPLAPIIAYGAIETTADLYTITIREYIGNQIDCEIVSSHETGLPDHYEEKRRWSYSTWLPGRPSPATGEEMREVRISSGLILGIARHEKRLLLHDSTSGINHLIPITNFYNELMMHKQIRDPKIALQSTLFFTDLPSFSDDDLRSAFIAYNRLKPRVSIAGQEAVGPQRGALSFFRKLFGK